MKILAWNCRGLGYSSAVRALKEVISSSCPLIVGIIETKCGNRRSEAVRIQLGFDCCFVVPARGHSGGLALFWNNTTDVDVVSYSGSHIDFRLKHKSVVHITLFYGSPKASLRHKSWELIRKLRRLNCLPWCVICDFNEICRFSESTSNNLSRRSYMDQFRQLLLGCGLTDLGYKGAKYTYTNKRKGRDEIKCRLDRAVGDDLWAERYPYSIVQHLSSHRSDHCPLLLLMEGNNSVHERPFRFESMWTRDANFTDTAQRSRVTWPSEGDNNTRFFHLKANARRRSNTISALVDKEGRDQSNQVDLEKVAVSYFQELFATTTRLSDSEIMNHLQCIPNAISEAHNRVLMEPYTEIEIKTALFQLYPFKAPGLDGFPAGFFQKYWNVIRRDFIEACLLALNEEGIPPGSNDTLIVLIPKHSTSSRMEEFRPISLTSVMSKTVAKVIVNRLQQILPEIISPAQSAFIKGRTRDMEEKVMVR
ncbi:hypothetical protein QQ045_025867 [Rhodiola kirilowii]